MSEYIHKAHNVSVLIYHIVCPAKYRRVVISEEVDKTLKETCGEIEKRYEIRFLEIGTEADHIHFLVQSVPTYSPTKIVRTIKSITAKEIFREPPEVKEQLWGGECWSDGYYVSTVGKHGSEETITNYVRAQGKGKGYKQKS
jgi:REP element-mobilizing transposase RayT